MKPLAVTAQERSPFPAVQQGRNKSMVTVSSPKSVQEKITLFEEKQGGGPLKKPQKSKNAPSENEEVGQKEERLIWLDYECGGAWQV